MKQLTIKELAPYLPYKLKGIAKDIGGRDQLLEMAINHTAIRLTDIESFLLTCKPLLHPLSKLTEGIEHNREWFVPIEELENHHNFSQMNWSTIETDPLRYPYTIVQKLFEWHFDVFGLLENNLAIEK